MKWINHHDAIRIHDDVMNQMHDTLNSITCYNPAQKMMRHTGLNLYGPTVIKEDGAVAAQRVFTTWADLFSTGPERIDREEVVASLRTLAKYSKSVANSNGALFLLHLGM